MRPTLAIGPLTNLQDARSSAAVGFDFLIFSLERGNLRMLGGNLIWNIASWVSGPGLVIEIDQQSLPELDNMGEAVTLHALSFPYEDWKARVAGSGVQAEELPVKEIWLRCAGELPESEAAELIRLGQAEGLQTRFVMDMQGDSEIPASLASLVLAHYPSLEAAQAGMMDASLSLAGCVLGPEAEEEFGQLNYEAIDDWLEAVVGDGEE